MGYTMLNNVNKEILYANTSMEKAALSFIRERCEELRFDRVDGEKLLGKSIRENQIPFNMEMDIDRLCLENAIHRFLKSGKKEDAFDVYYSYLHMFVGEYERTRRMIELLSEFEMNGSELLMKHRDHYVHSVYVFVLGLAIYEKYEVYRNTYQKFYNLENDKESAHHYLHYWGLASLFHDIGYPFELPFEQVASYFEINNEKRSESPFISYNALEKLTTLKKGIELNGKTFTSTNALFAYLLFDKLGHVYNISEDGMHEVLSKRVSHPQNSNYFMDHAYFSATVLYQKLFEELECKCEMAHLDALTAILLHNSLYKFDVTNIRSKENIPFKMKLHPLAFMLMLCDELQCWDRTSYGRNSKKELHPMGCNFELDGKTIKATYLFDEKESVKVNRYIKSLHSWKEGQKPELKAYSKMYVDNGEEPAFVKDIERIVDLSDLPLMVDTDLIQKKKEGKNTLSTSNFINLYNFATVLNGRWGMSNWKEITELSQEEQFLKDEAIIAQFRESFKHLSLEYQLSNINQAKSFAKYMNAIHCFYSDKEVDFEFIESFSEEELLTISFLEHQRWLQEHYDMGWSYGEPEKSERELVRKHKDMIPNFEKDEVNREDAKANYDRLEKAEQDKDSEAMQCMLAMLKVFDGIRIYRL